MSKRKILSPAREPRNYTLILLSLIFATLIFRIMIVRLSPLGLHGDEAQYWAWSTDLDWGYFTKPPLIAWVIATSTQIFGQAEWAIRLPSALIHSLTAWVLFLTGRQAFNSQTGFWAACTYLFMPAVWLSSTIISTDVPLLLCWALALNAWVALRLKPSWPRAIQFGLAIGFGLLAKYAMLFFIPAIVLALCFDKPSRRAFLSLKGVLFIGLITALFFPNILWNLNHDFATVSHTADNSNLEGTLFNLSELVTFWIDQFGVFGPISLALLLLGFIKIKDLPVFAKWIAVFVLVPLSVISFQAFLSRANANWAVTAYIGASLLVAVWAVTRPRALAFLKYGLIGQSFLMIAAGLIVLSPTLTDQFGLSNAVKRLRAWPQTLEIMQARFEAGHEGKSFVAFATDKRLIFYNKTYYDMTDAPPLYMWRLSQTPKHHADLTASLPKTKGPILLINYHAEYEAFFRADFKRLIELEPVEVDLGGGKTRFLKMWAGYDYTPTDEERTLP